MLISQADQLDQRSYNINAEGNQINMGGLTISQDGVNSSNPDEQGLDLAADFKFEDIAIDEEELGHGASATVYRGYHEASDTEFALKKISVFDRSKRHQLLKEIRTLYRTKSPYIVKSYGAYFREGHIYISLEFMDSGSIQDLIDRVKIVPENAIAYFAKSILEGLSHLKAKRQVHRDIKPSNVVLNKKGEAKLADFGITTQLDNTAQEATSFVGTNAYMSPERILGNPYSFPGDIWSVGIMLIQMAIGKFPFPSTKLYFDFLQAVAHGPSPTLPDDNKFSTEFKSFVDLCLIKDVHERAVAEDLLKHPFLSQRAMDSKQMQAYLEENMSLPHSRRSSSSSTNTRTRHSTKTTTRTAALTKARATRTASNAQPRSPVKKVPKGKLNLLKKKQRARAASSVK
jgi:serine/threonine protein kinase